jgi:hypothetical protein
MVNLETDKSDFLNQMENRKLILIGILIMVRESHMDITGMMAKDARPFRYHLGQKVESPILVEGNDYVK